VVAYVGLDPVEHSSAEKKRYGSISKEGCRFLRFLLVETAQKAVGGDQELRAFYYRLLQRKERAKARVAVARKVLTRSYIMLRDGIDYGSSSAGASKRGAARCVGRVRNKARPGKWNSKRCALGAEEGQVVPDSGYRLRKRGARKMYLTHTACFIDATHP
jgi:hypothetical protein